MHALAKGENWICRIWVNEKPKLSLETVDFIEKIIGTDNQSAASARDGAVELAVHLGGHCAYALLHAIFIPESQQQGLTIRVYEAGTSGSLLKDTIAIMPDEVHLGIPRCYSHAILESACGKCGEMNFPAGLLLFDTGAHGNVDSSEHAFSIVTGLLVELLVYPFKEFSREEIVTFIDGQDFYFHKGQSCMSS
jgi:hypothetical protein